MYRVCQTLGSSLMILVRAPSHLSFPRASSAPRGPDGAISGPTCASQCVINLQNMFLPNLTGVIRVYLKYSFNKEISKDFESQN